MRDDTNSTSLPNTRDLTPTTRQTVTAWLRSKFTHFYPLSTPVVAERVREEAIHPAWAHESTLFANPFAMADLGALDDDALRDLLAHGAMGVAPDVLGRALQGEDASLKAVQERVRAALPDGQRVPFESALAAPFHPRQVRAARRQVLDAFFWELVYWKMPKAYDELTEGERLHPGIFAGLAEALRGRVVLDVGAGAGRATFAALEGGAARVIAVEPSAGLRRLLGEKVARRGLERQVEISGGSFAALPLPDASVDVALSCSAFTADREQGGEDGLAELRRVTRPGGLLVIIWPRPQDYAWLAARGFHYVALSVPRGFGVRFRSLRQALRLASLFYARHPAVLRYLRTTHRSEVPYRVLGFNPPHDYCWLRLPARAQDVGSTAAAPATAQGATDRTTKMPAAMPTE